MGSAYNGAGYPGASRFRNIINTAAGLKPPTIDEQPKSLTVNVGETATFMVNPGARLRFNFNGSYQV